MAEFSVTLPETPDEEQAMSEMQRKARQYALDYQRMMLQHVEEAQAAIDVGDYSYAATCCHRAHQAKLQAEAMRAVLVR